MKITSVNVYLLDGGSPGWRPIVCRVNTDEGIYGYGEASVGFDTASLIVLLPTSQISAS